MSPAWRWPSMILGLLGLNVVIVTTTIMLARADAPAVEADYYQRAVNWDRDAEVQRLSDALGWRATIAVRAGVDGRVVVELADAGGQPVAGAGVWATVFHHAHADRPQRLELSSGDAGEYSARLGAAQFGLWQVSLEARSGDKRFLLERAVESVPGEGVR